MVLLNFRENGEGRRAYICPDHPVGFNRPTNVRFGPDGCAYVVDCGAVRDPGGDTRYVDPADARLV